MPRVCGIFTTNTISPSRSLRQCSSRYAIHARRNLPDKEFRYLRTLIVRAAVYGCFGRQLLPHLLSTGSRIASRRIHRAPGPKPRTESINVYVMRTLLGERKCGITAFLNIPAPSRRQSLYVHCKCLQRPVFLINSRRCRFSAPAGLETRNWRTGY